MLKLFARFVIAMIVIAGIYLAYTNTTQTALKQFKNREAIFVNFQNLPEIILHSKEGNTGYQYELLENYLYKLNKQKIEISDAKYDLQIYYSTSICKTCIIVEEEDLLLVSNNYNNINNDIEINSTLESLSKINNSLKDYQIYYTSNTLDDLIFNLNNNLISHTILPRGSYLFYKKYYPNLTIKKHIGSIKLLWKFSFDDGSLKDSLFKYLESDETLTYIESLNNKYYSNNSVSSYIFIGSREFIADMATKLPVYEDQFKEAADVYNLDWKLLAAISYQESKWNNNAISPTGVKGLMMLTKSTADMLGVNRLNPTESILGASKYITQLSKKYIKYNKNTMMSMTLGAYNVGPGHISDIIILAMKDNVNIENWLTLKKYLLKLHKKQFYKNMEYGYARGWEAVQYIENVKQYYDIISFLEEKDKKIQNNIIQEGPKTL
ncbi:transglycosylase SLT domain-containing protein [Gammaproteobacteria bacterium]|nr:transglycosylase SLT domain-containing protein [Gammaproteobacteria bacterium]